MGEEEDRRLFISNYVSKYFEINLFPSQVEIIYKILFGGRRVSITAMTRYGKSFSIALGAIMYAVLNDNKPVGIVAPTGDKAQIIMNYVLRFLANSPYMSDVVALDLTELTRLQRLGIEVSRRKITFKNGSYIEYRTADILHKGRGAMGFGFSGRIIIDESGEIPDDTYSKLFRMALDSKETGIIELGNPWSLNHFYRHRYDKDWDFFRVDYQIAINEGRITKEEVEEQRKEMTELEFRVLMESDFPPDIEYAIFTEEGHIKRASIRKEYKLEEMEKFLIGIDVARSGSNKSVLTVIGELEGEFYFIESKIWGIGDLMKLTGYMTEYLDKYPKDKREIKVDVVGLGAGLYDRLKEMGYEPIEYKAGGSARKKSYFNAKSEDVFALAKIMYNGRFFNLPYASKLTLQLKQWTYERRSDKQTKVVDPEPSPDEADSLLQAISDPKKTRVFVADFGLQFPQ